MQARQLFYLLLIISSIVTMIAVIGAQHSTVTTSCTQDYSSCTTHMNP